MNAHTYLHTWVLKVYHRLKHGDFGTKKWKRKFKYFGKDANISWPSIISLGKGSIAIGDGTMIRRNSRIENYSNGGKEETTIQIGANCDIGYYFTILNASKITIGDNVLIASNVFITSENHGVDPTSQLEYKDQPLAFAPVNIGSGCWIGEKVCILPGVTIGKKCIIGAGSVVTNSIPNYCIAVGNPARVIKKYNFNTNKWEKFINQNGIS